MRATEQDSTKCACGCGKKLEQPRTGRRKRFATEACRKRHWEPNRKKSQ